MNSSFLESVSRGDKVQLNYENPHKTGNQGHSGYVEKVGSNYLTIRDEVHDGQFRSFSVAFITSIRKL